MLFFIGKLFDDFIGRTVQSVTSAAEVKLKQKTVGKAQAKVGAAQAQMTQKALRGVDKATENPFAKKKK